MDECRHETLTEDEFAKIPSVKREVPGNAFCQDCGRAVPYDLVRTRMSHSLAEKVNKALRKGEEMYAGHQEHVDRLVDQCSKLAHPIQPVGEDLRRPELWKGIHWLWFLQNRNKRFTPATY